MNTENSEIDIIKPRNLKQKIDKKVHMIEHKNGGRAKS